MHGVCLLCIAVGFNFDVVVSCVLLFHSVDLQGLRLLTNTEAIAINQRGRPAAPTANSATKQQQVR